MIPLLFHQTFDINQFMYINLTSKTQSTRKDPFPTIHTQKINNLHINITLVYATKKKSLTFY